MMPMVSRPPPRDSDINLIAFLKRCKAALRDESRGLIVVKENLCRDDEDGGLRTIFYEEDSSLTTLTLTLTRSNNAWKKMFEDAGLRLVKEQPQHGLSEGLYEVKI